MGEGFLENGQILFWVLQRFVILCSEFVVPVKSDTVLLAIGADADPVFLQIAAYLH